MDRPPLLSVLISAKNEEKCLPGLLHSLEEQTYENMEVIIVDNESTDRTPLLIRKYAESSRHIVKTKVAQGSLAEACNEALDLASGEYIVIVGGDEVPIKIWAEEHMKRLLEGCDACLAPVIYFSKKESSISTWYFNRSILEILFNRERTQERKVFNTGNVSFRAKAIKRVRFYKPMNVSVDGEMSYRFLKHGYKLCYNDKAVVYHPAPKSLKHHISFWWKLAYANRALLSVHPNTDLKKVLIRNLLFAHLDPREWVKTARYRASGMLASVAIHLVAFLSFIVTYSYLSLVRRRILYARAESYGSLHRSSNSMRQLSLNSQLEELENARA